MSALHDAYERIKSGDKAGARNLLKDYLRENPHSPNGWWLMYNALEDDARRDKALARVLEYQPDHKQALKAQAKREAEARQRSTSFDFNDSDFAMDDAKEDGFSLSLSSDNDVDFASAGTPRKKKKSGGGGVALAIILGGLGICIVIPIAIIVILALLGPTIGEEFERIIEEEGLTTLSSGSIGEYNSQGNISVGQSMNGNVDTFTDDGWQFEGASGQSITVEVLSRSDLDPQLFIYGPDNMLIAENDDISMASGNFNSRVTVTLPTSGRYIFVVSAFGSGGAYEIRVS